VRTWVKSYFRTQQGIKNFADAEANEMASLDPDFSRYDLVDVISKGDSSKWKTFIQAMPEDKVLLTSGTRLT